jgi:hypothetical protein
MTAYSTLSPNCLLQLVSISAVFCCFEMLQWLFHCTLHLHFCFLIPLGPHLTGEAASSHHLIGHGRGPALHCTVETQGTEAILLKDARSGQGGAHHGTEIGGEGVPLWRE